MHPPDAATLTSTNAGQALSAARSLDSVNATTLSSIFLTGTTTLTSQYPASSSPFTVPSDNGPLGTGECKLLGSFAILVQVALGALALLSLVFKRWRERPQRPVKIWAFDVSKQVFGTVLLHLANLFMSMLSAGEIQRAIAKVAASTIGAESPERYQPNPCSFYLLNLAIDTTIGIPILILILKVLTLGAYYTPMARPSESIQSGNYGDPPRATWWLKQSLIYFLGLLGMKACVFVLFQLCPWIVKVGDWALRWTEGNEAVQVAFVMFIFPLIMNAMQYYIIDIFIKKRQKPDTDVDHEANEADDDEHGGLLANDPDTSSAADENDEASKYSVQAQVIDWSGGRRHVSYDSAKDGEITPVARESSSIANSDTEGKVAKQKPIEM